MTVLHPTSPAEVQEAVRAHRRVLARGGGSKPALSTPAEGQTVLEMKGLSGVVEYDPGEYVLVAKAGTPLAQVEELLAQHGQYLPFDPPLAEQGATLGGTVAAGLSGPMRQRYGGVRDFILGVQFVDGEGQLVRAGGKVVKNAAGFDLPKLMVGSLGRLGLLTELAFKVFPYPKATATLQVAFPRLEEALEALYRLAGSPIELYALDLVPPATLTLRLGGLPEALPARLERLRAFVGRAGDLLEGEAEAQYWRNLKRLELGEGHLVKVALTPRQIPALEQALGSAPRRYMSAGHLLYLAWNHEPARLDALLRLQNLSGLVLKGPTHQARIGIDLEHTFGRRVAAALDPQGRFSPTPP
ncbi:FAD-binding protein [Meiothermus taiwanensis]|jgi:glycolate oxidase FAD binding subunit|uniref:FAD linked oxidase n=2 Tax=Meiothermus taiwanensis TaxID=172827 RepID=A0ABM6WKQ0_9DEIN|nr:FAD-binding protein [Meiothermus taiwanensis]AWR87587.1 FAD linked oxidase [Meiothermus taiwanensis WR-220]KIQ54574.1 2-hydroxy-acid oxidase [Meiothermus taiwanensis]KZK16750.1 2-hydroxy-acid oxidase [Meiothermus taiwanensis]RIH75766.1 putative FAD-linked oxidoreductase [Meiothermus taiwanensis]